MSRDQGCCQTPAIGQLPTSENFPVQIVAMLRLSSPGLGCESQLFQILALGSQAKYLTSEPACFFAKMQVMIVSTLLDFPPLIVYKLYECRDFCLFSSLFSS